MTFEEKLEKAKKRIEKAEKIRIGLFVIATLFGAVYMVGYFFSPEAAWFKTVEFPIVCILLVLVIGVFIATFSKFPLIAMHNRLIKMHDNGEI